MGNVPCRKKISSKYMYFSRQERVWRGSCRIQTVSKAASSSSSSPDEVGGKVSYDPEGLFASIPTPVGGHFARREKQQQQSVASTTSNLLEKSISGETRQKTAVEKLFPDAPPVCSLGKWTEDEAFSAQDGIAVSDMSAADAKAFHKKMSEQYMPVDLNFPGLRILHLDPPVFAIDDFFTEEQCDHLVAAATSSGLMRQSKVGSGNIGDSNANLAALSSRRTSSSMLIDLDVQKEYKNLKESAKALQTKGHALVFGGSKVSENWGPPGKLPLPRQYCYEALQVAEYRPGQYFAEHEDAFPPAIAAQNGFQRHATLLVYLTSCSEGGGTTFQYLDNISVRPRKGRALLFFPSFSDSTPDPRTLHSADPAVDLKWVTQQWIARGTGESKGISLGSSSEEASFEKIRTIKNRRKRVKANESTNGQRSKGFGS